MRVEATALANSGGGPAAEERKMMTFNSEIPRVKFRETFRLEKFLGEKVEGDGKVPFEVIEGGDKLDTVLTRPDGTRIVLKTWEEIRAEKSERRP